MESYLHITCTASWLQRDVPTHHFICVDSAYCSVGGRFKFCLLELSGTFFLNILICNWSNPQMQKPWIWKVDCICSSVCNMSFFGCLYDLKIFSNFIIGVCVFKCFFCNSFNPIWKNFGCCFIKYFLSPYPLLFLLGTPIYIYILGYLILSHRSQLLVSFFFFF